LFNDKKKQRKQEKFKVFLSHFAQKQGERKVKKKQSNTQGLLSLKENVLQAFFIARNLKRRLEIKSSQVIRLFHQQELGCHSRKWKQLFSSPRLSDESYGSLSLLFVGTGLLLQWGMRHTFQCRD
jgi:hypothetical protein